MGMKYPLYVHRKACGHKRCGVPAKDLGKTGVRGSACGRGQRPGKCQCLRKRQGEIEEEPVREKNQDLESLKPKEEKSINMEQKSSRAHQPRNLLELAVRVGQLIKSSTVVTWEVGWVQGS